MKLSNIRLVAISIVFILFLCLLPTIAAQREEGFLRITGTEHPIQVPRSYSFTIQLMIEYGFHDYFEFHAAVYEGAKGRFDRLLWQGTTQEAIAVGKMSVEAGLESPSSEGQWIITAYVFLEDGTGGHYFSDSESGPGFAEINIKVSDNARLTLRAPYANVPIVIDDESALTDSEGKIVRELAVLSTHRITSPQNITLGEGWRAAFMSWNRSDKSTSTTVLMTTDILMTLELGEEFYLDIASDMGSAKGAGWYASGSVAEFSVPRLVSAEGWQGALGVQMRFSGWTGDVESSAPYESIVMNRPHRVVANWTTEYERAFLIGVAIAVVAALGTAVYAIRRLRKEPSAIPETEVSLVPAGALCSHCGAEIEPDDRHCSKCGRSQISSD